MQIILDHVTYEYQPGTVFASVALRDISLTIRENEFLALIGHTGCGKSTLVQHLNGLIAPTSGHVYFEENGVKSDINEKKYDRRGLRRRVGLVFQYPEHQLFEETVLKDICFGPKNMGQSEAEALESAKNALSVVGLSAEYWEKSPFELSGGQKRRVAIAGVLAMKPKVLILDEPASGLDPAGRNQILDLVKKIHESGTTVIMVSHSMDDVARLCTRVIVLAEGRVALDGTPAYVYSKEDELHQMGLTLPEAVKMRNELNKMGFELSSEICSVEALAEALKQQLTHAKR